MEQVEKQAYLYWFMIKLLRMCDQMIAKGYMDSSTYHYAIEDFRAKLRLDDSVEQLADKAYVEKLIQKYGESMEESPIPEFRAMAKVKKAAQIDSKYRSFTELLVQNHSDLTPGYALQSWLRSRNTLEFLRIWEKNNNPEFDSAQAEALIKEMEKSTSPLTLKKWVARTGAIGIAALQGRYGGTYAHPVIARDFEIWLSPEERYTMLTSQERDRDEWFRKLW